MILAPLISLSLKLYYSYYKCLKFVSYWHGSCQAVLHIEECSGKCCEEQNSSWQDTRDISTETFAECKNFIAVSPTICRASELPLPKDLLVLGLSVPEQKSLMPKNCPQCQKTQAT